MEKETINSLTEAATVKEAVIVMEDEGTKKDPIPTTRSNIKIRSQNSTEQIQKQKSLRPDRIKANFPKLGGEVFTEAFVPLANFILSTGKLYEQVILRRLIATGVWLQLPFQNKSTKARVHENEPTHRKGGKEIETGQRSPWSDNPILRYSDTTKIKLAIIQACMLPLMDYGVVKLLSKYSSTNLSKTERHNGIQKCHTATD
ncbi:hypothetical protein EVAR_12889_1 [Eumeta japonica]|uniref:Uncharacterized protein n=1 Tax=Eumeta variegata TaxID=151549 RepID=A0A4C1TVT2_EUMVA|nr:hypothetical protein EVAR_12889_1 [Eumeta japonica]